MGQAIRPSQFILTYGVGSIIEAPKGPRIVPVFDMWDISPRSIFSGSGSSLKTIENDNAVAQLKEEAYLKYQQILSGNFQLLSLS